MIPVFKFALLEGLSDEFLPTKAEPYATGWDVRASKNIIISPGEYFKIPLGFRAFPPEGWWFHLHPRSSSFTKKHMHNLMGIIDEHYSNEVLFAGQYVPDNLSIKADNLVIKAGEAIGQIVPIKRTKMKVELISNEEYNDLCKKRMAIRQGGFGSTDIK
jgi:dUTPase